jgi:chromosome condensin MukBEF ATPase and DNA-binding subunit MukB
MSSTAETDAEDVNDFLKRIQELGTKRDQEDEERNRKLEEEILQGRKERQARRAGVCTLAALP